MASPAAAAAAPPPAASQEEAASPKPDPAQDAMRAKMRAIMAINADASLSDAEKARRRQDVMMGKWAATGKENQDGGEFFWLRGSTSVFSAARSKGERAPGRPMLGPFKPS